jgi:outer membrane protein OmpA-like peptidoglycan-associated protein
MTGLYTFLVAAVLSICFLSSGQASPFPSACASAMHLSRTVDDPDKMPRATGLKAEYYNGTHFEEKLITRTEAQVNYQWSGKPWLPGLEELSFSARWTGVLYAPAEGTYTLIARVDDGIRLWLGGQLLIDEWHGQSVTTYRRIVRMKAGKYYNLKIEYFNHYGPGAMQLFWETPETATGSSSGLVSKGARNLIPKDFFFKSKPVSPVGQTVAKGGEKPKQKSRIALVGHSPTSGNREAPARQSPPPLANPTSTEKTDTLAKRVPRSESMEKPEIGKAVVLKHVLFVQSQYVMLPESHAELDELVRMLLNYPDLRIEIAGHTDNQGDPRLNQALSENRATVVAAYLIRNGVAERRIEARGYGSTQPITDNSDEAKRAQNRRVEFTVR